MTNAELKDKLLAELAGVMAREQPLYQTYTGLEDQLKAARTKWYEVYKVRESLELRLKVLRELETAS